jgi:hypothetical protein
MTEELSGRRIVVPETRELGLLRMLEERRAQAVPYPMNAIRDAPDHEFAARECYGNRSIACPADVLAALISDGSLPVVKSVHSTNHELSEEDAPMINNKNALSWGCASGCSTLFLVEPDLNLT